jgi:hypothetical protein
MEILPDKVMTKDRKGLYCEVKDRTVRFSSEVSAAVSSIQGHCPLLKISRIINYRFQLWSNLLSAYYPALKIS